jgi:ribosomal protein L19
MLIEKFEKKQVEKLKEHKKSAVDGFNVGDTLKVNYKIT